MEKGWLQFKWKPTKGSSRRSKSWFFSEKKLAIFGNWNSFEISLALNAKASATMKEFRIWLIQQQKQYSMLPPLAPVAAKIYSLIWIMWPNGYQILNSKLVRKRRAQLLERCFFIVRKFPVNLKFDVSPSILNNKTLHFKRGIPQLWGSECVKRVLNKGPPSQQKLVKSLHFEN